MTQQDRLKKLFEENASITSNRNNYMNEDTFLRVASELLEEREKCQCGLTLNVTFSGLAKWLNPNLNRITKLKN